MVLVRFIETISVSHVPARRVYSISISKNTSKNAVWVVARPGRSISTNTSKNESNTAPSPGDGNWTPPVPPGLAGFEIAGASNDGGGRIAINFGGPVRELVEGTDYIVDIGAEASEGGIRVSVTQRNIGGELVPNGNTINDADEVNGSIAGVRVDTIWEWPADDQVVVNMTSTEGVPIPTTEPSVTITVMPAGSTDEFTFSY